MINLAEAETLMLVASVTAIVKMLWELHADNKVTKSTVKEHGKRITVIERNVFEAKK